jgi:copper binding plastocyanin/azurin family protein
VTVPEADRFTPFALQIRAGDSVRWVNNDEDNHFVVSDDAFNTAGNRGTNQQLTADGGSLVLRFRHPGTFVYYCRLHSHLDAFNQPVAPGPDGGIQDANGNFGTPMSGVITVLPRHD